MAISLVAHAEGHGANNPATGAIDTTGANLIVVTTTRYGGSSSVSVTDNKGNTFTGGTEQLISSGDPGVRIWRCENPIVGSGHTFTFNGTSIFGGLCVAAFSGAGSPAFDTETGVAGSVGAFSVQPGSITPPQDGCLLVTTVTTNNSTGDTPNFAVDSSFIQLDHYDFNGGVNYGGTLAYLIQGTAGAVNPTWSWSNSVVPAAAMMDFKPATGGGGGPSPILSPYEPILTVGRMLNR